MKHLADFIQNHSALQVQNNRNQVIYLPVDPTWRRLSTIQWCCWDHQVIDAEGPYPKYWIFISLVSNNKPTYRCPSLCRDGWLLIRQSLFWTKYKSTRWQIRKKLYLLHETFKEEISEKNQNKPNTTLLTKDNYGGWQASFRIPASTTNYLL